MSADDRLTSATLRWRRAHAEVVANWDDARGAAVKAARLEPLGDALAQETVALREHAESMVQGDGLLGLLNDHADACEHALAELVPLLDRAADLARSAAAGAAAAEEERARAEVMADQAMELLHAAAPTVGGLPSSTTGMLKAAAAVGRAAAVEAAWQLGTDAAVDALATGLGVPGAMVPGETTAPLRDHTEAAFDIWRASVADWRSRRR